jgi:hypothetical protein
VLDERQLDMRVGRRVAVTRKMLAARRDARFLQRSNDGAAQPGHVSGFFGEGPIANDRVLRVRVNVEYRCEIERDADRL